MSHYPFVRGKIDELREILGMPDRSGVSLVVLQGEIETTLEWQHVRSFRPSGDTAFVLVGPAEKLRAEARMEDGEPVVVFRMPTKEKVARTTAISATAFRHRTPGEGVGGVEWDLSPGEARRRVEELLDGGEDYETYDFSFEVSQTAEEIVGSAEVRDAITREADARAWESFEP